MPRNLGGLFGWVISTLLVVAVGIFILSRIPPIWRVLTPSQGA
jgi:hypothetical protein